MTEFDNENATEQLQVLIILFTCSPEQRHASADRIVGQ